MGLLLLYLLISLFFSFLCSVLEAVILSIPPTYIEIRLNTEGPLKKDMERIKYHIDQPLSAILTLNTFAHTLGAAGVGAQAQIIWGNEYLSVVSALLTILILVLSEIIPKTLGASYWKELAPASLRILRVLIFALYPFVKISQQLTRLFKKKRESGPFTRSDLQIMAELTGRSGSIQKGESLIIQNLMKFNDLKVSEIMTPRTVLLAENEKTPISQMDNSIDNIPFSRIPVYHKNIDQITGFVLKDDLLRELTIVNNKKRIKEISRPIHAVPENMKLLAMLEQMIQQKVHIALVVDEYGGTSGIVTMEDLIETLLGLEITDETDHVEDLRDEARKSWYQRARKLGFLNTVNKKKGN